MVRKDRAPFSALCSITTIRDDQGNVTGYLGTLRDVTADQDAGERLLKKNEELGAANKELTAKEEELRTLVENLTVSEKKFRSLFETMEEGVALHEILCDDTGTATDYRILDINPAFEINTGIPAERIRGKTARASFGTGDAPYLEIYAKVAATGQPASFETFFAPLDRHFHISVFSPKKGQFATVFTDISGRKLLESERISVHRELERQHALFSGIINSTVSNIFSLDRMYCYTSFNQQHAATMKALFGSEIGPGKNILDCITIAKDKKAMKTNLDRAFTGETVVDEGYTGDHSISRQYMEPSFNPIRNVHGEVIGVAVISRDATERKKAEKALQASEERYRRLTENSQDIIFRLSLPDRKFEYVNTAALTLTGYPPDSFYQDPDLMQHLIHPNFRDLFAQQWERMPKGDIPREYEYQILDKDGKLRWFHQRNTIVRDSIGHIVALEGIVTDFTDRKNAEIALKQTEEQYRHISDNTGDVIWILNLGSGKFTFISPSVSRLLGYTVEESYGLSLPDTLTPESLAYVNETIPKTIAAIRNGDESARIQTHHVDQVRKDGSLVSVEIVATLLKEGEPERIEILGVSRDITGRKRAADTIRDSEEKYRALAEKISDLVWEIDENGIYTYVSPKVREMLGYEPEELIGKSPFAIMPPDEAERMADKFNRLAELQLPVSSLVNRCLHKNGSAVIMDTSAVPVYSKEGVFAGYRGIDRDITQRKLAQDALQESEERYRTFVESANEAIFVIQDGMIPISNKKGLELIGYDAGYLATHSFLDLLHPDDRASALDRHQRRLRGEKLDPLAELRVTDGDGVQHWLEINAIPVPWDGKPASLNFATDITERKKADDALAESERSYHGLFNTVKEAIYIQDRNGCFLNVNDGAVAMYGYPREYFIGKTPEILSAEGCNDLKELNDHFRRAFEGEPQYFEFWGKRKNGEVFPKEVRLYKGSYFGKEVLIAVASDITERKNAEEAIKESEERFRKLLQRVPTVAIQGYRPDHTVVYWNEANTRIYGYTAEEALGKDLRDLIVPGPARSQVTAAIARMVETGIPEPAAELELMKKDGSLVSIFSSHAVVKLPGRSTILYCIDIDLTERKRDEEALKNSETYLKTIISSVQTGLVIIDPENHAIVDVNPAAENLIGVKRKELIGSVCHKFTCPAEEGNCPVTDLGSTVDNSERKLLTSDGTRSILKTVVPVTLSGKKYLLESFIDITDRKHTEAKLAESEEKFHLIFRNSNDAIYLFEITPSGMPGRIVDANEVASLQTGQAKEILLKKTFLEIHSHELPQKSRSIMMELLTKGQVRFETDVARKDGARLPVEVSAQFAKLNQRTYVIAISRDVSRRKREERALRIANQKLQLMNIVAWHDIQNKVTGLRGYVELSKDLVTDDQMKRFIQSEEEVLKVIHQQLQYTKEYQDMGVHPQGWINLHETHRMILSLAELGNIQLLIDVGDLEIFCDPVIAKVFSHLMDNTKIHGKRAKSIHISCHETAEGLILVYEDDGVGISDEQKKELFVRNVGISSGFSLFFIHDILEVSEMTIRETWVQGKGARFEIGIPRGIYRFHRRTG